MSAAMSSDPERDRLENRRICDRFEVRFRNIGYTVTVGRYTAVHGDTIELGSAGEIFIHCHKNTGELTALARDAAISISLAMQHRCPLSTLAAAMTREEDGTASGLAGAVIDEMLRLEVAA
jgi:hypothetical protein